jgi:hypothetical protein
MPGAGRVKRRWLTSTVDKLFRAQQAATVTQRTDEIENNASFESRVGGLPGQVRAQARRSERLTRVG